MSYLNHDIAKYLSSGRAIKLQTMGELHESHVETILFFSSIILFLIPINIKIKLYMLSMGLSTYTKLQLKYVSKICALNLEIVAVT